MVIAQNDEGDSRTASIGQLQNRRDLSDADRPLKRRRVRKENRDVCDFVPRGMSFSGTPLEVEDATSADSSRSDNSDSDKKRTKTDKKGDDTLPEPAENDHVQDASIKGLAPSVNWNSKGSGIIRTALRGNRQPGANTPSTGVQEACKSPPAPMHRKGQKEEHEQESENEESESSSSSGSEAFSSAGSEESEEQSDGDSEERSEDSDESGELSDGNDDILLNMSSQNGPVAHRPVETSRPVVEPNKSQANGLDRADDHDSLSSVMMSDDFGDKKAAALATFRKVYSTDPVMLGDLTLADLQAQAKYVFFQTDVRDLDRSLPVRCLDCMGDGHLAEVCPEKECKHCCAWNVHDSRFCPSWRRCPRCRERGHDRDTCQSELLQTTLQVPCELCGSDRHLEDDCDLIWKPWANKSKLEHILISVSCSFCTSKDHLLGDCPIRNFDLNSSSWTLRGHDPARITKLNPMPHTAPLTFKPGSAVGYRIRGNAGGSRDRNRSSSPESDGAFGNFRRPHPSTARSPARGLIRINSGIGRGRNLGSARPDDRDRYAPLIRDSRPSYHESYRDHSWSDRWPADRGRSRYHDPSSSPPPSRRTRRQSLSSDLDDRSPSRSRSSSSDNDRGIQVRGRGGGRGALPGVGRGKARGGGRGGGNGGFISDSPPSPPRSFRGGGARGGGGFGRGRVRGAGRGGGGGRGMASAYRPGGRYG